MQVNTCQAIAIAVLCCPSVSVSGDKIPPTDRQRKDLDVLVRSYTERLSVFLGV